MSKGGLHARRPGVIGRLSVSMATLGYDTDDAAIHRQLPI